MNSKLRLDELLVERGYFPSRSKAVEAIKSGKVLVKGETVRKPGKRIAKDTELELTESKFIVSRAYYKLEKALEVFKVPIENARVCDLGASTGGFTQLLLERGAKVVFAVDVGTAQLHPSLKSDMRVVSLENTDARSITKKTLDGEVDLVTVDLSFISITKVIDSIADILRPGGHCVSLIKPQFESGPGVSKKGVVHDMVVHEGVLANVIKAFQKTGFSIKGLTFSPVKGKSGNIEYIIHAVKGDTKMAKLDIEGLVKEAFKILSPKR
ncbi:TlyA family RNA methyltransferase [Kosmotoga pacifica]|uniref:RNA-binding S4 domain-containing protein n=1 Tax=Kosmotoga pacifica TaxID=1330330 RepID=A0A0G2Z8D4_9BACT|nr:TlyA family RNA methyltransferase [Kosmotoga pacifica]AKI97875.1 hypothetical protein IX53_08675 [Kosmotoga pacifica]